jgi:hypothetical protein
MAISRDNRLRQATDKTRAGLENLWPEGNRRKPSAFIFPAQSAARRRDLTNLLRRIHVNVKKILGFLALGGLLAVAAPAERAQALSPASPGIAAAVLPDSGKLTTEVRWHHHHGWRRHHGWRHRHWGWRRHHHRHWRW